VGYTNVPREEEKIQKRGGTSKIPSVIKLSPQELGREDDLRTVTDERRRGKSR